MAVFANAEELYACIADMMETCSEDPGIGPRIQESNLVIRFIYQDPQSQITVDAKNEPTKGYFNIFRGDNALVADVTMEMTADIAHQFWLGKVNLMAALTRGEMRAKGPIPAIMKMLPAIKPAFDIYRGHLQKTGFGHLAG